MINRNGSMDGGVGNKDHRRTIVCAPLSHISFTNFFLARGVGSEERTNAERARVFWPRERSIRSGSRNDFCQMTLVEPKSSPRAPFITRTHAHHKGERTLKQLFPKTDKPVTFFDAEVRNKTGVGRQRPIFYVIPLKCTQHRPKLRSVRFDIYVPATAYQRPPPIPEPQSITCCTFQIEPSLCLTC